MRGIFPSLFARIVAGYIQQMGKRSTDERFRFAIWYTIWRDLAGYEAPTTAGIIHYAKGKELHMVPAQHVEGGTS